MKGLIKHVIGAVAILLVSCACYAFELKRMPVEERVSKSEIIVLATVSSKEEGATGKDGHPPYASLSIERVYKGGAALVEVELILSTGIAEESIDCCNVGQSYLVFARPSRGGRYRSSNGPYGVYKIESRSVVDWRNVGGNAPLDEVEREIELLVHNKKQKNDCQEKAGKADEG